METEGSLPHSQVPATCPYQKIFIPYLLTYLLIYSMEQSPS